MSANSDGFGAGVITAICICLTAFVLVTVGMVIERYSWLNDCAAIGFHVYGGKIYDCKERK